MIEVLYCAVFFLIYVLILFNGVDDVMLRSSCGLSIRGLARTDAHSTDTLAQECRKCQIVRHSFTAKGILIELLLIRPQDLCV